MGHERRSKMPPGVLEAAKRLEGNVKKAGLDPTRPAFDNLTGEGASPGLTEAFEEGLESDDGS